MCVGLDHTGAHAIVNRFARNGLRPLDNDGLPVDERRATVSGVALIP
jgi:hypothetical protein